MSEPRYPSRIVPRRQVYFIQAETMGHIKIGHADDWRSRLNGLQVGNPDTLKMLGFILTDRAEQVERELHAKFWHLHFRGEWFRAGPDLLQFILDFCEHEDELREPRPFEGVYQLFGASPIEPLPVTDKMLEQWQEAERAQKAERASRPRGRMGDLIEYKLARGIALRPKEQAALDAWREKHPAP